MGSLWFEGPKWLSSSDKWPQQPEVAETSETARESAKPKLEKQLFAKEEEQNETTHPLLHKYASYWKLLRVTTFMKRSIDICRKSEKQKGPLTTKQFEAAEKFWITQVQTSQPLKSEVSRFEEGRRRDLQMCWQSSTLQSSVSTPQLQVSSFDRSTCP